MTIDNNKIGGEKKDFHFYSLDHNPSLPKKTFHPNSFGDFGFPFKAFFNGQE